VGIWRPKTLAVAAPFLAVALAGCDYACRFERKAACPQLTSAQLQRALLEAPGSEVHDVYVSKRPSPTWTAEYVDADLRAGYGAYNNASFVVELSKAPVPELRVAAQIMNRPVRPDEKARAEALCARLTAACPQIGPWEDGDMLEPPSRVARLSFLLVALGVLASVPVGVVVATVWLVRRASRR
jgi:hypothetical protein